MPSPRSGLAPIVSIALLGLLIAACDGDSSPLAAPHGEALPSRGQALPIGSTAPGSPTGTADLFVAPASPMIALRSRHTASLLANGAVLAAGGTDGVAPLATAELFNPITATWTGAAPMTQPREQHAAVVLANGTVLVTGGLDAGGALAGVELYTPQTSTWTARAPMVQVRARHTLTKLANGNVLALGGTDGTGPLASAEIYDISTNIWAAIAPLHQARTRHTTALLADGRVIVIGGVDSLGNALSTTEILSAAKGTWSFGAPLATARHRHTMTPLADGSLLVVGGAGAAGILASAERYSPITNRWISAGSMAEARADHTALITPLGHVVVAGGQGPSGPLATSETYEPAPRPAYGAAINVAVNPWFAGGSMSVPRAEHTVTLLAGGKALHAGGAALPSSELFDDTVGALGTTCAQGSQCSSGFCATGVCCDADCSGECTRCNPNGTCFNTISNCIGAITSNLQSETGSCVFGFCSPSFQPNLCGGGVVMQCGGSQGVLFGIGCADFAVPNGSQSAGCDAFGPPGPCSCIGSQAEPTTGIDPLGHVCLTTAECGADVCADGFCVPACAGVPCWSPEGHFTHARLEHTATSLSDGKVLFAGGRDQFVTVFGAGDEVFKSGDVFDPTTGTWTTSSMAATHHGHTATLLSGGDVLVLGGATQGAHLGFYNAHIPAKLAETYTPASNTWAPAGPLLTAREYHTATLLPGGQILVLGGIDEDLGFVKAPLSAAELYAPATGTSTLAAPMPIARDHHTATLLSNGRVLVLGGTTSTAVDLYDPPTDTWLSAAPLPSPRARHTTTALVGGKVLVTGGDLGQPSTSALLYDPAADTWTPAASMAHARAGHAATIVTSGDVIVAGGGLGAERYNPSTDTWAPFGAMLAPDRHENTANLLPDGRLLIGFGLKTIAGVWATVNVELTSTLPAPLGQPCSTSATCGSAVCVDGVCCDTSCALGPCDACTVALGATADGICTAFLGAICDDGNACTTGDACQATGCAGTPATGLVCDDGNPCTTGDACQSGSCAGSPATGLTCDDGNACTSGDTCLSGVCGGSPVVCTSPDLCHYPGSCVPQTGQCSAPYLKPCPMADACNDATCDLATGACNGPLVPVPDGTTCDDGDACTGNDSCSAGVCTAGAPILLVCPPLDFCQEAAACVSPLGCGVNPPSPDGTPCPFGTCQAGTCTPSFSAAASASSSGGGGAGGDAATTTGTSDSVTATSSGNGGAPSATVTASSSAAGGGAALTARGGCSVHSDRAPPSTGAWLGLGLAAFAARRRRRQARRNIGPDAHGRGVHTAENRHSNSVATPGWGSSVETSGTITLPTSGGMGS